MDEPTQSRLLERIAAHLAASGATTTDTAETTLTVDPLIYTDQDRWERERALLSTAPTAVWTSVCMAMARKIAMGAPPGTMMKGSRAPKPPGPKLCRIEPSPQTRKVALMTLTVKAASKPSVWATRKTAVMGEAAITRTC